MDNSEERLAAIEREVRTRRGRMRIAIAIAALLAAAVAALGTYTMAVARREMPVAPSVERDDGAVEVLCMQDEPILKVESSDGERAMWLAPPRCG